MKNEERSLFWVKPEAFSELITRLETPKSEPAPGRGEAASAVRRIDVTQPMKPLRETRDDETTALYALDLSIGPFSPPEGSLEQRFAALLEWLEKATEYDQAFVADPEGLALIGDRSADELVAATVTLGNAWRKVHSAAALPEDAPLAVDLPGARRLHILPGKSPFGVVRLGFLTPKPLSRIVIDTIHSAFRSALPEDRGQDSDLETTDD